jgi:uncharacterized SAM-binding protein YcdF (DUF218 family)
MGSALAREFGVPVRWIEARSRNTHENAIDSAAILHAAGVTRAIVVSHAFDFPRARSEFESAGIAVTPAPVGIPSATFSIDDLVPGLAGLQLSYYACYELAANALYRVAH